MGLKPKPLYDELSPVQLSNRGFRPLQLISSGEMPKVVGAGLTPLLLTSSGQRAVPFPSGNIGLQERPVRRPGQKAVLIQSEKLKPIILLPNPKNISVIVIKMNEPIVIKIKQPHVIKIK